MQKRNATSLPDLGFFRNISGIIHLECFENFTNILFQKYKSLFSLKYTLLQKDFK